jgi:hypothetical protein
MGCGQSSRAYRPDQRFVGSEGSPVQNFYCYLMNADGQIRDRLDVTASTLEEVIKIGFAALRDTRGPAVRPVVEIEIWSGASRLFSGKPEMHDN